VIDWGLIVIWMDGLCGCMCGCIYMGVFMGFHFSLAWGLGLDFVSHGFI
jgi:hypothetical protein